MEHCIATEIWTAPNEKGLRSFHAMLPCSRVMDQIEDVLARIKDEEGVSAMEYAEWTRLSLALQPDAPAPRGDYLVAFSCGRSEGYLVKIFAETQEGVIPFAIIKYLSNRQFVWDIVKALTESFDEGAYYPETLGG